jgi:hypothetical protein
VRVNHFLRKQHLVPFDPFIRAKDYSSIRDATRLAVDGDLSALSKRFGGDIRPHHHSALLYALFQEVSTLFTSRDVAPSSLSAVKKLQEWIRSHLNPEDTVLLSFTRSHIAFHEDRGKPEKNALSTFLLFDSTMTPTRMLQLSCICRAIGVGIAAQSMPAFRFLYDAIHSPLLLSKIFLPTMPSDTRLALMEVLGNPP